jgi:hypothetical protein
MAGALYTYRIVFDESGGENNETPVQPANGEEINTQNPISQKKDSATKTAIQTTMLQQIGKNAFNFVTSNIGQWTGNSALQNNIGVATKTFSYAVGFYTNWKMATVMLATKKTYENQEKNCNNLLFVRRIACFAGNYWHFLNQI